ncbi:MAG: VTT domain-containing protein [Patescibacteria group bacterium]
MEFNELPLSLEWLSPLSTIFTSYPYAFLFVGLLIGGETILLPALYLGMTGVFNTLYVVLVMIVATIISDIFWYALGRGAVPTTLKHFFKNKLASQADRLHEAIQGKELLILFFSKFVYGTRIAAQVLCGIRKVSFWRYLGVNIAGVLALAAAYVLIIRTAFIFSYNAQSLQNKFAIIASILIPSLVVLHLIFKRIIKREEV